ncbi:AAA family ATPase [Endozoicomonas atrinae]|uniref:nucleotide-binding protein n=1 Tax=Endozoicomonas atrinae TaxID=1333660 RepID=UPI0008258553|nr:AAA family ATPase [Endozoicomonas atrinae]
MRILVMNSKGGAGKTTLTTTLISYYLSRGMKTALIDMDPQGSSAFWAEKRQESLGKPQVIEASKTKTGMTNVFQRKPEAGTQVVVTDTPAGVKILENMAEIRKNDVILIPVLPSSFDIKAVTLFIGSLLINLRRQRVNCRIAVIANRCRLNTKAYGRLMLFLNSLDIPFIGTVRDSQTYVHASENGIGIFDKPNLLRYRKELEQWYPIIRWLREIERQKDRMTSHPSEQRGSKVIPEPG